MFLVSLLGWLSAPSMAGVEIHACIDNKNLNDEYDALNRAGDVNLDEVKAIETRCHRESLAYESIDVNLDFDGDSFPSDILVIYAVDTETGMLVDLAEAISSVAFYPIEDRETGTLGAVQKTLDSFVANEKVEVVSTGFLEKQPNDTAVKVVFVRSDDEEHVRYLEAHKGVTLYGKKGVWLPTGLFGVAPSDEGLVFNTMPIGAAWGLRFNLAGEHYIGPSLGLSWTIASETADTSSFTVRAASPVFLIDISDAIYLGANMTLSFEGGGITPSTPGVVFGITPRVLDLLKGQQ